MQPHKLTAVKSLTRAPLSISPFIYRRVQVTGRCMFSSTSVSRKQQRLPAAYYRGGTSRAVIFKEQDLPPDREQWAAIFRGVIGSPDPHGRQLDGMGGGISSLSKVCVVGSSSIGEDADVDYTFAAIGVKDDGVDYSSNCGNMSAAIGPFALDSGLLKAPLKDGECVVNIHNTNTGKIIRSTFPVVDGEAAVSGDFALDGVAGTAAPVRLDFLHPAGSKTGKLLPTGQRIENLDIEGTQVDMTCIDAGNPCVFVKAQDLLKGDVSTFSKITETLEENKRVMQILDRIRRAAGVNMGLARDPGDIPVSVPKIALVWTPQPGEKGSICVRALSVGQAHKAVPVTVALSLAAAAQLPGTVAHACARSQEGDTNALEIRHPTGSIVVDAAYADTGELESAAVYRTARRLMEGTIFWK